MGWFLNSVLAQPTLSILRYIQETSDLCQVIEALFALGRTETASGVLLLRDAFNLCLLVCDVLFLHFLIPLLQVI